MKEYINKEECSYHFIGNHLVWFSANSDCLKYIKLFDDRNQTLNTTNEAQRYQVYSLDIYKMASYTDEDQIMISEVPDYSYHYQKRKNASGRIEKYQTLLQLTIINNCFIFTLDGEVATEIASVESIDHLMNFKRIVNCGFKPCYSLLDEDKDNRLDNRTIEFSPNGNYCFEVIQIL